MQLDPIQQRVVGVLLEKQQTVPDSYPLTENALISGANQKSNRDPHMEIDEVELHPALLALREDGWVSRVEGGGRATKYRHRIEERLNVDAQESAVLCELLLRGPQAPGALKPRVARLGLRAEPQAIEDVLERLAARPTALVQRQPKRPRERDHRWGHLLGPRDDHEADEQSAAAEAAPPAEPVAAVLSGASSSVAPAAAAKPAPRPSAQDADLLDELVGRVRALEAEVTELRQRLDAVT